MIKPEGKEALVAFVQEYLQDGVIEVAFNIGEGL